MLDGRKLAVFELEATVQDWDDDYYHPLAIRCYDRAIPWLLNAMGAQPGDTVLDAGCGPGVHAIRAVTYGCKVDAIDISETMLGHAKSRAEAAGVAEDITFSTADLTNLDLPRQYDHVFSWGVIIHIPEIDAAIENLAAAVAPGGALGLSVLSSGSADFAIERMARKLLGKPLRDQVDIELGTGNWYEMNGERLWVLRFDIKALDARMAELGFDRVARRTAEFTEFQRRSSGVLRNSLLWFNNLMSKYNPFPAASATQMLVYKRR